MEFSSKTRSHYLKRLKEQSATEPRVYDAVIVGGGIVGAGLLRELAIRGINALLVEKKDFASGTSSKSSKLIHGGLRYLEMYDFGLVFESLSERHWLLKTMPHFVQPLRFNLPVFDKAHAPAKARAGWLLGLGLWFYDALSLFHTPFFHGKYSKNVALKKFPGLLSNGLQGTYYYADAMMMDDELVLECIYDGVKRGGFALNYTEAKKISKAGDGFYDVDLFDHLGFNSVQVRAREVIVCVGPWTEKFGDGHVAGGAGRKLKPSKGVHLVFPWKRFPIEECFVMYAADGRIVFAIPRKDLGPEAEVVIVGTTDSPEMGDPGEAKSNAQDEEYLLTILKQYFPDANLTRNDVITTYAGVRPLIDDGEHNEAQTSREHEIWRNSEGIVFMAGGKYTTFRRISQEIADFAFPKSKRKNKISKEPLSSAEEYAKRFSGEKLWGKFTDGWIRWKLAHHCPCTNEDLVFRRIPLWLAGKNTPQSALERIKKLSADYFDFPP